MFKKILVLSLLAILTSCGGGNSTTSNSIPTVSSYTLGGTISSISGISPSGLVLTDGTDNFTITGSTSSFTFPTSMSSSTAYTVSVKTNPGGVNCSVTNGTGSGTISTSNVNSVTVNCTAGTESIIHAFTNAAIVGSVPTQIDGANPQSELIMDSAGNLYGTTYGGGTHFSGTVFEITTDNNFIILHSFNDNNTDGISPQAGLIMDALGNLYGTTNGGGTHAKGVVFELARDPTSATGYATNDLVLYNFNNSNNDGQYPAASLIMDSVGNLYGTTTIGGIYSNGTVFELTKDSTTSTGYATLDNVLYNFAGGIVDGNHPSATLIMDSIGNLFGTTRIGGTNNKGIIFELAKDLTSPSSYAANDKVLYNFAGGTVDGAFPYAALIMDSSGNLFSTTQNGGINNYGIIFELTKDSSTITGYAANDKVLYSFTGGTGDGAAPQSSLILDGLGNLYGTTSNGGNDAGTNPGYGVIFKLTKDTTTNTGYSSSDTVLYKFNGTSGDGAGSISSLIIDSVGNLYGTTYYGYNNWSGYNSFFSTGNYSGYGVVFKLN